MSGYKKVSFYELCRLCASSIPREKTHIFLEEGRKIQLQNKIQACLSLNVQEDDFLPKVVCLKCVRQLEICYTFREGCITSESMLSTYFKNFRYTEDFKKSGKVYIKDTKQTLQQEAPTSTTATLNAPQTLNAKPDTLESPYYALQLPTIVSNPNIAPKIPEKNQFTYNLNLLNASAIKNSIHGIPQLPKQVLSNVVVNSNGEVINIAEPFSKNKPKKVKNEQSDIENAIKIDLTHETCIKSSSEKTPSVILPVSDHFTTYRNVDVQNYACGGATVVVDDPKVVVDGAKSDTKPHVCEVCQKTFKRREHLYQHMKLHTGFRPYVCETCNKAFMRKEHLLRHTTLHSGQKNFLCPVCNKSFSRNDNLLKHKKTHEKQSSYTCEVCQKVFVMKHYYEAHKTTHGEKCYVASLWASCKS